MHRIKGQHLFISGNSLSRQPRILVNFSQVEVRPLAIFFVWPVAQGGVNGGRRGRNIPLLPIPQIPQAQIGPMIFGGQGQGGLVMGQRPSLILVLPQKKFGQLIMCGRRPWFDH